MIIGSGEKRPTQEDGVSFSVKGSANNGFLNEEASSDSTTSDKLF